MHTIVPLLLLVAIIIVALKKYRAYCKDNHNLIAIARMDLIQQLSKNIEVSWACSPDCLLLKKAKIKICTIEYAVEANTPLVRIVFPNKDPVATTAADIKGIISWIELELKSPRFEIAKVA